MSETQEQPPIRQKPVILEPGKLVDQEGRLVVENLKPVIPTEVYNRFGKPVTPASNITGENVDVQK